MHISKIKKKEFDTIFKLFGYNNFYIDIKLFRNLFESDYYEYFLSYIDNKINELLKTSNDINIHTDIKHLLIQDTYYYYDKIIKFCKLLHKYTTNIKKIIIYGSSSSFNNIISLINLTLGINIYEKIIFSNDNIKIQSNNELEQII